MSRVLSFFIML